jgi:hypothetical protein
MLAKSPLVRRTLRITVDVETTATPSRACAAIAGTPQTAGSAPALSSSGSTHASEEAA